MAIRYAIVSGNWSSTATWNNGATLGIPTSADNVFSNGFTVNVDTNINVISLNNSASFGDVATPLMTSNVTPVPYSVTANDQTNGPAWSAFDRNATTSWFTTSGSGGLSNLIFDFSAGDTRVIKAYSIFTPSTNATANPRVWTFDGSNNGSTWVTLDSVTLGSSIGASSVYNSAILANTTAYRYYRLNVTSTTGGGGVQVGELGLWEANRTFIAAGGNFNFNTSNVTANLSGALNLSSLVVNSTGGGTITINAPNSYIPSAVNGLLHSGTANLVFNSLGNVSLGINSGSQVVHTSTGNLTLGGTIYQHVTNSAGGSNQTINSSGTGSIIINGSLEGQISGRGGEIVILKTSSGTVTITGNVSCRGNITIQSTTISALTIGGNLQNNSGSGNAQIILGSPTVTVSGNVSNGGTNLFQTTAGIINVGGDVTNSSTTNSTISTNFTTINVSGNASTSNVGAAIASAVSSSINIFGSASASTSAVAVSVTNSTAQVYLRGNMFNNNGRMAIYAPIIWLNRNTATQAQFFTSGGVNRTLFSEDTFPNLPPESDTRKNTVYGPGLGLTGSLAMPAAADAASGVIFDNGTTGTALFTTAQLLSEITTSSDPVAVRLRNAATPEVLGELMEAFKK